VSAVLKADSTDERFELTVADALLEGWAKWAREDFELPLKVEA